MSVVPHAATGPLERELCLTVQLGQRARSRQLAAQLFSVFDRSCSEHPCQLEVLRGELVAVVGLVCRHIAGTGASLRRYVELRNNCLLRLLGAPSRLELQSELLAFIDELTALYAIAGDVEFQIRRCAAFVAANPALAGTLEEMASRCYLSRFHFGRLFKKHMSVNYREFVIAARLNLSKRLLETGSHLSIQDVARQSGFRDSHYFSRVFKQRTGMSPSRFRHGQRMTPVPD